MVVVLAALCLHYGQLPWIQGLFYGIGAAVIAIIARSTCVSDERGKAEAIVDVTKDEIVKTLHFDLQDRNILAVIDPTTDEVIGRYPVGRCKGNHGMTLDPEHHRAFLACEENNLMTVFDLDKHEAIESLPMADEVDVIKVQRAVHTLAVDPETHRVYTPEQEEDGKPVARMAVYEAVIR